MSSNYQSYDFIKDINFHIKNKNCIDLSTKSEAFKMFFFKLVSNFKFNKLFLFTTYI